MPNIKKSTKRKKRKMSEKDSSNSQYIKKIFIGSTVSVITFFAFLLILSLAVVKIGVSDSMQNISVFLFALLSTFVGAFFSLMKTKEKGLVSGLFVSLPAIIFVCIILLIVHNDLGLKTLIMSAMMLTGGALGGIAAVNKKTKKR